MEVTVETALFQKALSHIRPRVPRLPFIPILQSVYLEARGSTLLLRGCDSEIFVECEIPADIYSPNKLVVEVPTKSRIFRALNFFKGYTTEIKTEVEGKLTFSSSDGSRKPRYSNNTFSPKTYPAFPRMDTVAVFGPDLVTALKRLGACITERVQHLCSVRLEGKAGRYKLAATDNFVLGRINSIPGPKGKLRLNLPPGLALDLMRLKAGEVTLLEGSKFMGARFGTAIRTSIAAVKVKQTTPKWKGLKRIFSIRLPSEDLRIVCTGEAVLGIDQSVHIWLHLSCSLQEAELKIVGCNQNESITVRVPFTGEFLSHDVMLEVNPKWLLNFFSVCECDQIRFELLMHKDSYLIRLSGCQNQRFYFFPRNVFGLPGIKEE